MTTAHEDVERGLWDLTACCRYYQTGACPHTEAAYEAAMAAGHPVAYGPHPTIAMQEWIDAGCPDEPF